MILCPLYKFNPCLQKECPFYNIRYGACLLPRVLLGIVEISKNTRDIAQEVKKMLATKEMLVTKEIKKNASNRD